MLLERHELTEVVAGTETKPEKVDPIYFIPYYQQKVFFLKKVPILCPTP